MSLARTLPRLYRGNRLSPRNLRQASSLGKVGQRYILNAKMLDVRTGETLSSADKVFPTLEELVDGAEAVALTLSES